MVNCHYIKTAELCGLDLASTMRSFSIDIINNSLKVFGNSIVINRNDCGLINCISNTAPMHHTENDAAGDVTNAKHAGP